MPTAPFTRASPPVTPSDALTDAEAEPLIRQANREPVCQRRIDAVVRLWRAGFVPEGGAAWRSEMVTMPLLASSGV